MKMGKLKTPDWILEGKEKPNKKKAEAKGIDKTKKTERIFKIKVCPKCGSDNVKVSLSNMDFEEESNTGKQWECKKCKWTGQNIKEKELTENEFMEYFLECILGGVHGINIRDIIGSVSEDSEFLNNLQNILTKELIIKEKEQFANIIFGSLKRYEQKFGIFDQNLRRSSLKLILL